MNQIVQPFSVVDQNYNELTSDDLQNKIWIANFIFTSCETVCPPMTSHLKELQHKIENKNMAIEIVSFSVDPSVDTPSKLKQYIDKFQVNQDNWHLVTGYDQAFINNFASESFQTYVDKPDNSNQVIHGTNFYLIDKKGVIKKSYDGVENPPYEEVLKDIQILLNN